MLCYTALPSTTEREVSLLWAKYNLIEWLAVPKKKTIQLWALSSQTREMVFYKFTIISLRFDDWDNSDQDVKY